MSLLFSKKQIQKRQQRLNQVLIKVTQCVNRKVSDPKMLDKFKNMFRLNQPKNLEGGKLKDYQKQALVWMIELAFKNMNGILADDMGLGKTIQTISYIAYLKQQHGIKGKHLIIAPLTVVNNWKREFNKWLPQLNTQILWATQLQRQSALSQIVKPRKFDVLITSYGGVISSLHVLKKITFQTLIIDEAHKIKNDQAILTESTKELRSTFKLLLTGTPLSNNLRQLWSLLNFIMPDIFTNRQIFDEVQEGVKLYNGSDQQKFQIQCSIAKKFHSIIRPFILRRTKKDTDLGLPPKSQHTLFVPMTKLQLKMYKNYLKYRSVYGKGGNRQTNSQMTTRKICNHPYNFQGIQSQDAEQYGEHIIQNCGKMIILDKLLDKVVKIQKQKVLIFSQFKIQLDLLEDYLNYKDINFFRLDGDTSVQDRQQLMEAFNTDKQFSIPVFMLSTRAGGLGINLVSASVVIIYDIDWNPQNDNQAMDRAYRIGQTRPVKVFKLITEHTIEQRMLEIQKYKLIWDQLVIQKGTLLQMKDQDLLQGLNYQKIANMKKGQIFKLQGTNKVEKTIDQIIKISQEKDQNKYKQIKQKILKQIQQQKQAPQHFVANPFKEQEFNDKQGQNLLKKYQSDNMILDQRKNNVISRDQIKNAKNKKRTKLIFMNSINLQHYHLYSNPDQIKELMYQIQQKNIDIMNLMQNGRYQYQQKILNEKIKNLEQQIEKMAQDLQKLKRQGFHTWTSEQFDIFIQQQMKQNSQKQNNIKKLHQLLPHKSMKEIQKYKEAFYSRQFKEIPYLVNKRKNVIKVQKQSKQDFLKSNFFKSIKQNEAYILKKGSGSGLQGTLHCLINNLRIRSVIQQNTDFLKSSQLINNQCLNQVQKLMGTLCFQKQLKNQLIYPKNLLRKFYNTSDYQEVIKNPREQNHFKKQIKQYKNKIITEVSKKIKYIAQSQYNQSKIETNKVQKSLQIDKIAKKVINKIKIQTSKNQNKNFNNQAEKSTDTDIII